MVGKWSAGGEIIVELWKHAKVAQKTVRPVIFIPIFEQQMFDKLIRVGLQTTHYFENYINCQYKTRRSSKLV